MLAYIRGRVKFKSPGRIGWSMATHLRTELVLSALEMASRRRPPKDAIHQSGQGRRYTSLDYESPVGYETKSAESCYTIATG